MKGKISEETGQKLTTIVVSPTETVVRAYQNGDELIVTEAMDEPAAAPAPSVQFVDVEGVKMTSVKVSDTETVVRLPQPGDEALVEVAASAVPAPAVAEEAPASAEPVA